MMHCAAIRRDHPRIIQTAITVKQLFDEQDCDWMMTVNVSADVALLYVHRQILTLYIRHRWKKVEEITFGVLTGSERRQL